MIVRYLDSDTLDDCRAALRAGRTIEQLAGTLGVDARFLAHEIERPRLRPQIPRDVLDSVCDRWPADAV